jgi:hypothetical protein
MVADFGTQKLDDAVHGVQYAINIPKEDPEKVWARPDGGAPVGCIAIFAIHAIHIFLIVLYNNRAPNLDLPPLFSVPSPYVFFFIVNCGHQVVVEEANLFLVLPDSCLNLEQ